MKTTLNLTIVTVLVSSCIFQGQIFAESETEKEVRQAIIENFAYLSNNLKYEPDSFSTHGALEFWSSGGLMHEISSEAEVGEYDAFDTKPKHIHVISLVEGQAAVAQYYSEGSMKPKGSPAVNHYLVRVTQVFVKENGKWKVRASHFSPVIGGSGTSKASPED